MSDWEVKTNPSDSVVAGGREPDGGGAEGGLGGVREREEGAHPDQHRHREHHQLRGHAAEHAAPLRGRPGHGQPHQPHGHSGAAQGHEPRSVSATALTRKKK